MRRNATIEEKREYARRYYATHKEQHAAAVKRWKDKNRDKIRAAARRRREHNPDKYREKARALSARRRERGFTAEEIDAQRARNKAYAVANRDRILAQKREYYRKNRERMLAQCRDRYERKKEEIKAYSRQWRENRIAKAREFDRERYEKNPQRKADCKKRAAQWNREYYRANAQECRDRARIRTRMGNAARQIATAKWSECDELCYICGKQLAQHDITADHVTPVIAGGPSTWNNVMPAHQTCNSRKNKRLDYPVARPDLIASTAEQPHA